MRLYGYYTKNRDALQGILGNPQEIQINFRTEREVKQKKKRKKIKFLSKRA